MDRPVQIIGRDLVRWSRQKWLTMFLVVLGLHVAALWHTSAPPNPFRSIYPAIPKVELPAESLAATVSVVLLEDPRLFAGANSYGFSSIAWLQQPRRDYALDWALEPPRFLPFIRLDEHPSHLASPPHTTITQLRGGLNPPALLGSPPARASQLTVVGDLQNRRLVSSVKLPVQFHNDVVGTTEVEAGVDTLGWVVSARVLASSGSRKADQDALAISRALRFESTAPTGSLTRDGKLTFGTLKFEWFALHSSATNALATP